jgi:hypothetical protein
MADRDALEAAIAEVLGSRIARLRRLASWRRRALRRWFVRATGLGVTAGFGTVHGSVYPVEIEAIPSVRFYARRAER